MTKQVDPKKYGLPSRTILIQKNPDTFILKINRKSRIIMKDALTILKKIEKIKVSLTKSRRQPQIVKEEDGPF